MASFQSSLQQRQALRGAAQAACVLVSGAVLCRSLLQLRKRYRSTKPVVVEAAPAFLKWSATRIAAAIRSQELSAVEVVEASILVLREADPVLNILAWSRFDDARREAASVDERVREATRCNSLEELPRFLGVPLILKEAFEFEGQPYTNGLLEFKGRPGTRTGPMTRRLLEAGFIVVASGNVSEACMWMESYNTVYGRSSNPFDTSRTPGGSSGGTAAAVAVLAAPVGVTADIGGSTRIPAFFNGLFGHKATGGLLPNLGTHLDNFHGAVCRICQPGVVTRHMEDLAPILKIAAGPPAQEEDPLYGEYLTWEAAERALPAAVAASPPQLLDLKGLRVVPLTFRKDWWRRAPLKDLVPLSLISSVSKALLEAQDRASQWLRSQGAEVCPMHFEDLAVTSWFETWADRNQASSEKSFREVICCGRPSFGLGELLRYCCGRSKHTLPALGLAFLEDLVEAVSPPVEERLRKADAVQAKLEAALADPKQAGSYGVFLLPTLPRHGCKHDELLLRIFDSCFTSIWNATEFPATAVPMGLAPNGCPLGLQIVSVRGRDALTLGLAQMLATAGVAQCPTPGDLPPK